jgi:ribA/ribD-fused uncharacterized protein
VGINMTYKTKRGSEEAYAQEYNATIDKPWLHKPSKITTFTGRHRFLSNFYPTLVRWDGWLYASVEHAYQAAKFPPELRERFRNPTLKAREAKRLGRDKGPADWKDRSLDVMLKLLRQKFMEPALKARLLETDDKELVEGNNWHDTFYGVCYGMCSKASMHEVGEDGISKPEGLNHLGKLIMQVRQEIRAGLL